MGKRSVTGQITVFASVLAISGCGWVDDTGLQADAQSEMFFDSAQQLSEKAELTWPIQDFGDADTIVGLRFQLANEGESVSACSAVLSSAVVASSLRDACHPQQSDENCSVVFDVGDSEVLVSLPERRA